jgi:hypothetical protein
MHTKNLSLLIACLCITALFSCRKNADNNEFENTFDLSSKQAISDNLTEDDNNVLDETVETVGLTGSKEPLVCNGTTSCAQITVSPGGFPKTITLDFGTTGCSNPNSSVIRRGIINIVLSDSLRRPGSTAVMTFNNYYVNNYKREGTITWTNTSISGTRSWRREVANGQITSPNGAVWSHSGIKNVTQVAGISTPRNLLDDAFSITGTGQTTNSAGITRQHAIIIPLHKQVICDHIDQGSIQIQGPNHTATLDFGNGICDNIATIRIDNYPVRTITLP